MAFSCKSCTGGAGNLGIDGAGDSLGIIGRVILMDTFDGDGVRNSILATALASGKLSAGYVNAKLIEEDVTKRWYITDKFFDEVEVSNSDRTIQTTSSGTIFELLQGQFGFKGKLWKRPASYKKQLNSFKCGEKSVFFIDVNGSLMGEVESDGLNLYPLAIQEGSVSSEWMPKSDSSESYVSFEFQLERVVSSENFLTIPACEITENLKKAESLIDVSVTATAGKVQTATTLLISAAYSLYGNFGNKGKLKGKDDNGDWVLTDAAGAKDFVVSAVVESSDVDGDYTITFTGGAAEDSVIVNYAETRTLATSKGFESAPVTIAIPA
ncbi:MAG: hypothetical protein HRS51_01265 [Candidatus Nitrosopelagicus sp.]|nr:hypothetical protein [Candidatus Nitrosopelagicus sp.]